jgi:hypothetical protein
MDAPEGTDLTKASGEDSATASQLFKLEETSDSKEQSIGDVLFVNPCSLGFCENPLLPEITTAAIIAPKMNLRDVIRRFRPLS